MTRAANGHLPQDAHRQIARLMQIHQQTHPARLATRWNLSTERIRQIWTELPACEQADLEDVLGILR
jgi:hypothetical protein